MNIYWANVSECTQTVASLMHLLSEDERQHAASFVRLHPQKVYVLSRLLMRQQLASALHCKPSDLQFKTGQHGKPQLMDHAIQFNLSHSGDWVVLAIDGDPVGVDIEQVRRDAAFQSIAARFFAKDEQLYIESADDIANAFYVVWTRKEAWLKAQGLGLSSGLQRFSVVQAGQLSPVVDQLHVYTVEFQGCFVSTAGSTGGVPVLCHHVWSDMDQF